MFVALCLIRHMKTAIKFFDCVAMKPKNPGNFQGSAHTGFAGFVGKTSFQRWLALLSAAQALAAALAKGAAQALGAGAASTAAQVLGTALLLYSCVPPESGGDTENTGAENNYGYANATFRYFYYPADSQIYYISENDIYKMDIDGTSAGKIKDNTQQDTTDNMYKRQYIYVFDGTVYYNDRVSNTTHKMRTDGKNHATGATGKSGQMGAYKNGSNTVLYFDGRKRHLMGNTLYYSTDSTTLGKKSPPNASTTTTITARQADNFVFAPDGIYFRLHTKGRNPQSYYGIVKARYDAAPQGTGNNARLTDADMLEIISPTNAAVDPISSTVSGSGRTRISDDFPTLNVSRNFIAYLGRNSGDLIVLDRNTTRVAKAGIYKPDNTTGRRPKLPGGISIIGDYIYWMSEDETRKQYVLHRVKKDGTGYAQIKTMPY